MILLVVAERRARVPAVPSAEEPATELCLLVGSVDSGGSVLFLTELMLCNLPMLYVAVSVNRLRNRRLHWSLALVVMLVCGEGRRN